MRMGHLAVLALVLLGAAPRYVEDKPPFISLFDGRTLNGWWSSDMGYWSVEDGAITGRFTQAATKTYFLLWQGGELGDFELKLKFRIRGGPDANSGIQFRSIFNPEGTHATGYQADIARTPVWLGILYDEDTGRAILAGRGQKTIIDESGARKSMQFDAPGALFERVDLSDWNEYHVIAKGHHLKAIINGHLMSEVIDNDTKYFHASGRLALQLHAGPPMQVQFKDILLKTYSPATPAASAAGTWTAEDPRERAALPEFQEEPAARPSEFTRANGHPRRETYLKWYRSHGDATNSRFSLLDQINRRNVKQLRVAWIYHSNDGKGSIQCNPIIVDGVLYAPTPGHHIVALNANTGKEIWRFRPGGSLPARRGLIYWAGNSRHPSRILFNSGEYLFALNAKTGKPIPSFGNEGKVKTGPVWTAGATYKNVLVIPGADKDVFGYDLITGKQLWTFHTVPHAGEFGYEVWDETVSAANCWGGIAMDERRGIAYLATGSPEPNFVGIGHLGRNLFANCVIALDASTGKRIWHFQEIRHDIWDLDIPAPPNLVTIVREGKKIDAVAQLTKLGNTLLLDRLTGKPIFPFRLRRAPVSKLPGERTWPYQPDLELPEPLSPQVFTLDDVTDRSPEARSYVMQQFTNANLGWFEPFDEGRPTVLYGLHGGAIWTGGAFDPTTGLLYVNVNKLPWIITVFRIEERPRDPNLQRTPGEKVYLQSCASCHGAERRGEGVAPPLQGLRHRSGDNEVIYSIRNGHGVMPSIPSLTEQQQKDLLDFLFLRDRPDILLEAEGTRPQFSSSGYPRLLDHEGYPGCKPPWGSLVCLNLNTGRIVWKAVLGEYEELTAQGIPKTGTTNLGGALVTAGGTVFCAGTRDKKIRAFDKETGQELWSHGLPWGGYAPPATYQVRGRQFVVIAATGGGFPGGGNLAGAAETGDAYVAFALP